MNFASANKLNRKSGVRWGEHGAPVQNQRLLLGDSIRQSLRGGRTLLHHLTKQEPPQVFRFSRVLELFLPRGCAQPQTVDIDLEEK
jgi:hypothetical protein